jgi:hypothetical protein
MFIQHVKASREKTYWLLFFNKFHLFEDKERKKEQRNNSIRKRK